MIRIRAVLVRAHGRQTLSERVIRVRAVFAGIVGHVQIRVYTRQIPRSYYILSLKR